jgi:ABC-type sugar transport system ATPase subunit
MIRIENLSVRVGQFELKDISFEVPSGQHAVLMGRTGAGKTTLLEALCGLRPIARGRICLLGRDATTLPPAQRGIGLVPQDGALFQHLTVREHLTFALVVRGWQPSAIEQRVTELTDWLRLGTLLARKPSGLSGGETQRVALARALSFHPDVLCLDEPLSALDEESRAEIGEVLQSIRGRTGVTILHITHSLAEARKLADRILRLRDGHVSPNGMHE